MTSVTVDVELPVRPRCTHFVSKNSDLIERCEGIRIPMKHEDFGLDCVSLRWDGTVQKPVKGNDTTQRFAGAS